MYYVLGAHSRSFSFSTLKRTWNLSSGELEFHVRGILSTAWAGLQAWATGHYVPAPEFSQGRLESTYQSLLGILEDQRSGKSSKAFNGIMHDLYVKVSQSQPGVAPNASGSANNVISLDIDSD
ncbi:hypothetical protein DFH09DRAFT_1087497 [Mycena vulgaris]|nr:hypothetical protein DFH09DRAFT_1087497 [Mycena vulgaris]